ncbi:putative hypothetical protein [Streptomyces sp. NBRC 110611]|nr:putative hypothetical protein [Streptomyces sp. NBRC 110611]
MRTSRDSQWYPCHAWAAVTAMGTSLAGAVIVAVGLGMFSLSYGPAATARPPCRWQVADFRYRHPLAGAAARLRSAVRSESVMLASCVMTAPDSR